MRISISNYTLNIYKTRKGLWVDEIDSLVTNIEIYNLEETVLLMKLKFSQDIAERIYSSLLSIADNPFYDNNNSDFENHVGSIGISLPLFELNYTYDIIMIREQGMINLHLIKKNLNGTNADIILIQMNEVELVTFAELVYDECEETLI